mgnify:CR=1 FL=1
MNFIDLKKQNFRIKTEIDKAIDQVLSHGQFIQGPEVSLLEKKLEKYSGSKKCISVANGTDAILISLLALGVKEGDEVIMPAFNYVSAAETVSMLGAKPVFVDVEFDTFNIDPIEIEKVISDKTNLIISTSLFGQCANFKSINDIASKHNLPVLEDAAQSFGASHYDKKSCNLTTIATTSFFPAKPLGCYGDGGAIFTNDENLAKKINKISKHGQSKKYHHEMIGVNSRLDTLQAAILLEKLKIFESEIQEKNKIACLYSNFFEEKGLNLHPKIKKENKSVYAQFTCVSDNREKILEALKKNEIPFALYYPLPLHNQQAYLNRDVQLKNSENLSNMTFSLPMHAYLTDQEIENITNIIHSAF